MGYRNLKECVTDLRRHQELIELHEEVDANLEVAAIQRRLYEAQGPAILFTSVKNCKFPMLGNLFGTMKRTEFLFRDAIQAVQDMIALKLDPSSFFQRPWKYRHVLRSAWYSRVKRCRSGAVMECETTIDQLPQLKSWPDDGGAFITLPEVYTEHPGKEKGSAANLGMYRVQLSGNQYQLNEQIGLHYQIHRGIGVHHAAAIERGEPLPVNIFVGGAPAMILAAVMPLPEGLSELMFAGALSRQPLRMIEVSALRKHDPHSNGLPIYAEADFCISGTIDPHETLPEGPFGDHLGYYSLQHEFPVMRVRKVFHRKNAIWPFTSVGRPPQEDTSFGQLIHELTGEAISSVLPGVRAVHAVDAAGVHPLLLAMGSERYVPYAEERQPQELLTNANAILGQGQLSLAKYLLIVAHEDHPALDVHDIPAFFRHWLSRIDWQRDLHFQTKTTIDTLDYSGSELNNGSKVVMASAGRVCRELLSEIPSTLRLPEGFREPKVCLPGILIVQAPQFVLSSETHRRGEPEQHVKKFCDNLGLQDIINSFPLIVLVDDSEFTSRTLNNFLWVTFTRSNPATDIHGIESFIEEKHWGCRGSLVIDARIKPHHAPLLIEDSEVTKKIEALAAPGRPLHGYY